MDIDKVKNITYNSRHLKRKVEKIDDYKLVPVPVDLNKLSDVVKKMLLLKKMYIMLRSKISKIRCQILLT